MTSTETYLARSTVTAFARALGGDNLRAFIDGVNSGEAGDFADGALPRWGMPGGDDDNPLYEAGWRLGVVLAALAA